MTATISLGDLQATVGRSLPGGRVRLEPYEHWLACDAVGAGSWSGDVAHPMFGYYLALRGMGVSLDDLFALAGSTADDGVMFGEARLELCRPLRVGGDYDVHGSVTAAERKTGRSGTFDLLEFRLEVSDAEGVAAVSTNTFVFPRPGP